MGQIHDYDKILIRLTIILQRLYEGEVVSVQDLAAEFNVSTKTIQRDFNQRLIRLCRISITLASQPFTRLGCHFCHAKDIRRSLHARSLVSLRLQRDSPDQQQTTQFLPARLAS